MQTKTILSSKLFPRAILLAFLAFFPGGPMAHPQDRGHAHPTPLTIPRGEDVDWALFSGEEVEEFELHLEKERREADFRYLFEAKNYLINGNLRRARFYLEKIDERYSKLYLIKLRYLALIAFIQGEHARALALLDSPHFSSGKYYPKICLLKVMSLMALRDRERLPFERLNCQAATARFSLNAQLWPESLAEIIMGTPQALKGGVLNNNQFILSDPEHLRVWLKLVVYLGANEAALKTLNDLPPEAYHSKRVRELVGMVHYRAGDRAKALRFIEDIDSANSENIKGNIALEKKQYELAYGHYKLALKHKENSLNAMERAIPLTWLLGQWEEGLGLLGRLQDVSVDERKKTALESAFAVRLGRIPEAQKNIELLSQMYRGHLPQELVIMASYVYAHLGNDREKLLHYAERACRGHDGVSCWLYLQLGLWENFSKTLARPDETRVDPKLGVEALKEAQAITPMDEPMLVDQRDIDELDSNEASLEID